MSQLLQVLTALRCDRPGCEARTGLYPTVERAQEQAELRGWQADLRETVCPDCREKEQPK